MVCVSTAVPFRSCELSHCLPHASRGNENVVRRKIETFIWLKIAKVH
jgi:hypothetical protein